MRETTTPSACLSIASSIIADTVVLSGSNFSLQGIIGAAPPASPAQIVVIE